MSQAIPASIIATFGTTAVISKRGSAIGASTATTPKRRPCVATKRRGSAETKSVSANTASANMKLGTVSAIRRDRPCAASSQSSIHELESEKQRWQDPAYVKEQARARFGYLMPGQTSYVVIGADGKPLAAQATLSDPRTTTTTTPTAWWTAEWKSVELAGNPPSATKHQPLKYLGGNAH